jgi:tripartite-type tricarboxylate transporter receptor subunit TctC
MKTTLRKPAAPQHRLRVNESVRAHPKSPSLAHHPRRRFLGLAAGVAALPAVSRIASAQTYPVRPITMIVPTPAGGGPDAVGRVVADRMRNSLGQRVIIENVTGADGTIAVGRAARARPDGYTIHMGTTSTILNGALYSLPYDVLNDVMPIAPLVTTAVVLYARRTMPAKNINELIAWLKANPNRASVGYQVPSSRLLTAFFQKETGTQLTLVPYRAGAMQDLVAGQIELFFANPDQLPLVRAGAIKAYAVTSKARLTIAPDIPTFAEIGLPTISYSGWMGLFAPRGTPSEVVSRLNAAVVSSLADPMVRSRLADLGMEFFLADEQTPEALTGLAKADAERWWPIIKEFGIKVE